MSNTQETKNQHTVPKCFLKNFSDDGITIYRKYKRAGNSELMNPIRLKGKNGATVKYKFYTLDFKYPMLVESNIYGNLIENQYNDIFDILVDDNKMCVTQEERCKILMSLLSLHCRTPKQFNLFFKQIPSEYKYEIDKIKEDYKVAHIKEILPKFIESHQFKIFKIFNIKDSSEFITCDNPVLILGENNQLKNNDYREQFNKDNIIVIPISSKYCCVLSNRNGISLDSKLFYNRIERIPVDCSFTQGVNFLTLQSAENEYYGTKRYMNAFFNFYNLV